MFLLRIIAYLLITVPFLWGIGLTHMFLHRQSLFSYASYVEPQGLLAVLIGTFAWYGMLKDTNLPKYAIPLLMIGIITINGIAWQSCSSVVITLVIRIIAITGHLYISCVYAFNSNKASLNP